MGCADDRPLVAAAGWVFGRVVVGPGEEVSGAFWGRSGSDCLLSVGVIDGGLAITGVVLSELHGAGGACQGEDSYCVFVDVVPRDVVVGAEGCVEIVTRPRWSALHVRMSDRWEDETLAEERPCSRWFRIESGVLVEAAGECRASEGTRCEEGPEWFESWLDG